jgi:8-oxo-dGTP pyrophosphatase MutT (NUDIX family)
VVDIMRIKPEKYWRDIIAPIIRRDPPPTIPQAVVLREQHVLLVKRDNPALWELPGGGMHPGEIPEQTVVREVYEETGMHAEIVELLGWYHRTGFRTHRSPVYVCRPTGGRLRPHADEVLKVRYFPLSSLPRGLFPWYRPILQQDVLSQTPRPLQRTQHLGLQVLIHCLILDLGGRLGLLE